jgi:hypothetical protein
VRGKRHGKRRDTREPPVCLFHSHAYLLFKLLSDLPTFLRQPRPPQPLRDATAFLALAFWLVVPVRVVVVLIPLPLHWWFPLPTQRVIAESSVPRQELVREKNLVRAEKRKHNSTSFAAMPGQMDSTGLAVGLKKGFIVEKRKLAPKPASRKGVRHPPSLPAAHAAETHACAPCHLFRSSTTRSSDAAVYSERVGARTSLERSRGVCVCVCDRRHGVGIRPQQGRLEPSAHPHARVLLGSHRPDDGQGPAASLLGRVVLDLIGVYCAGSKDVMFGTEGGNAGDSERRYDTRVPRLGQRSAAAVTPGCAGHGVICGCGS